MDHRQPTNKTKEEEDEEEEKNNNNLEFLVKWKGRAHIHNTWNTYDDLLQYKGAKKLTNYIKQLEQEDQWRRVNIMKIIYQYFSLNVDTRELFSSVISDIFFLLQQSATAEERESYDIAQEMNRQTYTDWLKVDRIISDQQIQTGNHCKHLY